MITDRNEKWVVKDRHEEVLGAGVSVRASAGNRRHHLLPQGSHLREQNHAYLELKPMSSQSSRASQTPGVW